MLSAYRTSAALRAATAPNFDPTAVANSTDTVYCAPPPTAQALHAPLVLALLDQIRNAVYKARPFPPVPFALDVLAQIAPLPDLASVVAEGGSQGLVVIGCPQDLSQARARWGTLAEGFFTTFTQDGPAWRRRPSHPEGHLHPRRRGRWRVSSGTVSGGWRRQASTTWPSNASQGSR